MSISKKYQEYLKDFPINIQWRITLTNDSKGFTRGNTTYFGPSISLMKNGTYGIEFEKKNNGGLVIREGSWFQDKMNGKGSTYYIPETHNKEQYSIIWKQGQWEQDKLQGKGIIRVYNTNEKQWKNVYIGNFLDNYKNKYGVYFFNNMKYEGQFENDCFHGEGRLTKSQDYFYSGRFKNGQPYGRGLQRRGRQVIIYNERNQSHVFLMPQQNQLLPNFYQGIISHII